MHMYQPIDFTLNFLPDLAYPDKQNGRAWNKNMLKKYLAKYHRLSIKRNMPIFVGEFGVNTRGGHAGEDLWLRDTLSCFKEFGFHWTYWTYKAVKNSVFPDGIFSYMDNPPWVNRQGPEKGFMTYGSHWPNKKKAMIKSWQTDNFKPNTKILKILKNATR